MKKITKIYEEEGTKYRFDSDKLMLFVNKKKFQEQKKGDKVTKASITEDLADELFVSVDAVKSWMYGYNGPSEIDQVKALGEFFHVDYHSLLKMEESEMERTNVMNEAQAQITKDCVRTIYKKMVGFIEKLREYQENYMLVYDEEVNSESAGAFASSVHKENWELRSDLEDILRVIEYNALDLPSAFAEKLEEYIMDKLTDALETYKVSPLHRKLAFPGLDKEKTENDTEEFVMTDELKEEMEAYHKSYRDAADYYEEGYRDDFKKLFADFMI